MTPKIVESPDDVLSTLSKDGKRKWVYPVLSPGKWLNRRAFVAWALIVIFVALPIIKVNDLPVIWLDVASRRFVFFGQVLFATDTQFLMLFGIAVLIVVVFFSALFGRAWCGWACPQTVYLEFLYRPIERAFEGSERKRRSRDQKKDDGYWGRKIGKWTAFSIVSILLAHVFVSYFAGWSYLLAAMTQPPSESIGYFGMMAFTSALILFDFGIFREQMCTITCPYARIQSVLLDRDSLIVSYDPNRGEPRGKVGSVTGDCVDCGACVRTCPTGIDIREGLQMECINCTQCIDACDAIMLKLDRPTGLIRYTSENALESKNPRILRPRLAIYTVALVAVFAGFGWAAQAHNFLDVNAMRVRGSLFAEADGVVHNNINLRIQNRSRDAVRVHIEPVDARVSIEVVGGDDVDVEPRKTRRVQARVSAPSKLFESAHFETKLRFTDQHNPQEMTIPFTLVGPK